MALLLSPSKRYIAKVTKRDKYDHLPGSILSPLELKRKLAPNGSWQYLRPVVEGSDQTSSQVLALPWPEPTHAPVVSLSSIGWPAGGAVRDLYSADTKAGKAKDARPVRICPDAAPCTARTALANEPAGPRRFAYLLGYQSCDAQQRSALLGDRDSRSHVGSSGIPPIGAVLEALAEVQRVARAADGPAILLTACTQVCAYSSRQPHVAGST